MTTLDAIRPERRRPKSAPPAPVAEWRFAIEANLDALLKHPAAYTPRSVGVSACAAAKDCTAKDVFEL
jgi:hypothetical protein